MNRVQRISEQTTRSASDEKYDEIMKKALQFMKLSMENYFNSGFTAEAVKLHDEIAISRSRNWEANSV